MTEHIGFDKRINVENGENAKDAPDFRGCLTIQNHGKKKTEQSFISENKHPISQNIRLWDSLFNRRWWLGEI